MGVRQTAGGSGGGGVKENYYALAVSICRGWVPELAFAKMLDQKFKAVDYADDMKALKQEGLYWKDIGELFGVTDSAAYRAVQRKTS